MENKKANMTGGILDVSILHNFKQKNFGSLFTPTFFLVLLLVGLLGVGTGYLLSVKGKKIRSSSSVTTDQSSGISKGTVEGSQDSKTFPDMAEGVLNEGGIDGEGEYHLVRKGGESQNVYLTSSVIDLSKYVARKIKVWGQTFKAQKAGWLMDVGRVEVLE